MTNEEALRLAKLAWPYYDVRVRLEGPYVVTCARPWDGQSGTLLCHDDRARFEAALRVLAGEP